MTPSFRWCLLFGCESFECSQAARSARVKVNNFTSRVEREIDMGRKRGTSRDGKRNEESVMGEEGRRGRGGDNQKLRASMEEGGPSEDALISAGGYHIHNTLNPLKGVR